MVAKDVRKKLEAITVKHSIDSLQRQLYLERHT